MLKDVVHENEEQKPEGLGKYIVPFDKSLQILDKEVQKGKIGYFRKDSQANRVYSIHGKAVTLCGEAGGGAAKMGQYLFGCLTPDGIEKRQNGQRFNEGNKFYTLTAQDRHGVLIDGYIRKLTPVECERLQTLPDNYTDAPGVTDAQRYKCLGNGWTVDVIAHILKGLKTGNGQEKDQAVRDWKAAENAINKSLEDFSNLGPAGMFGVKILTPLRVRYDKGERTADLFNAIVEATR